jgi:PAS domain S-box-containing protein
MVESTTDWIWEVDADLKCTYVTPNVESGIGYKPEELIGKTFEEMVRKEDIDKARELQEKLKKNPVPFKNFETVVIHKNGNEIFTERNAIPLFDSDGKFTGYIGVSRDITKKKQDEARFLQNQKMEELGTVAAGVAHDFNNMLTGVYGNIELAMLHLAKDSPAYNFISQAHKINKETTLLTNKLLTFSKGALPNLHSINLPRLVKEVVEHLNNNKINIDYKIDENLPNIMGDSQLLKTAIFNVIKNAVEHAEECSKILIEMSKTKYSTEASESSSINEGVKLVIKDNGQGISQNIISKIFDPYFSTKKMGIHGQGLGLSVTQNIIKKHFGEISVTSSKEHGTAFSIILPVATENQTKEPVKCRENSLKTPDLALEERTPKVIIMDDEPLIIEICSGMLKTNGFMDIDSAENGDEVIEKYKKAMKNGNKYDIVILDLMVTEGKGGLEAVKEILKIDSDANIIVSSGYATDPVLKAYKSYGFKAALPKPYTVNDLKNIIKELLS